MKYDVERILSLPRKWAVQKIDKKNGAYLYFGVEHGGWVSLDNKVFPPTLFDDHRQAQRLAQRMNEVSGVNTRAVTIHYDN